MIEAESKSDSTIFRDKNGLEVVAKLLRINCVSFQDVCARLGIRAYPTVRMYKRDGTFGIYHGERKLEAILDFLNHLYHQKQYKLNQKWYHIIQV